LFKYLARQPFWVHLLIALALILVVLTIFLSSLSWFTKHGTYLKVPLVKGKNVDDAVKLLEANGFEVVMQDSVYVDSIPKYTVVKQLPDADATVKVNRVVYLTINRAEPPAIAMPKLEGLSYRFARDILLKNHLAVGDTTVKPDFMKGSVLEQDYKGDKIEPGTMIPWGSKIDLVIGGALPEEQIPVPDLIGLTYLEAKRILDSAKVPIGGLLLKTGTTDTASAFVYKQNPDVFDEENKHAIIHSGQPMDIWLQKDRPDMDSIRTERAKLTPINPQ
jgi:eukaryotic-like serine/threonine-protein kinase